MDQTGLSIIIVSFNTRDLLRRCLLSLVEHPRLAGAFAVPDRSGLPTSHHDEIIVVDNASHDRSAEMVEREFPWVRLERASQNLGFARATNLGLSAATGNLVMLLNPDTEVTSGSLSTLARFLASHPDVGVAGPALLYPDGSPQHAAFRFPNLWMSFFDFFPLNHRVVNSKLNGRYGYRHGGTAFEIDHPLGAAMMVKREAFDDVGPFDQEFFIYCEEVDWCIRAKRRGWKSYQVPLATVVHHSGQSTRQFKEEMFVQLHRSRNRLFRKHYSHTFLSAHRVVTRAGLLRKVAETRWAQARGSITRERAESELRAYRSVWGM